MPESVHDRESPQDELIRRKVFCGDQSSGQATRCLPRCNNALSRSLILFIQPTPNLLLPTRATHNLHHHVRRLATFPGRPRRPIPELG